MTTEQRPPLTNRSAEDDLPFAVTWRLILARGAMLWERFWPALWPALALLGVFVSLSLFGVWDLVPEAVQALGLFAIIIGAGYALWRKLSRTRLPARAEGLRRLEVDSKLDHRPLSTFADRPAGSLRDPKAQALWRAHRARIGKEAHKVQVVLPRIDAPRHDPYALRLLLVLVLGVSVLIAGTDVGDRLRRAVAPLIGPGLPADLQIDAWLEPPAYTGLPNTPLLRAQPAREPWPNQNATVEVPEGSVLVVRLTGFAGRPVVQLSPITPGSLPEHPDQDIRHEDGVVEGRTAIPVDTKASLTVRGRTLGAWSFLVRGDQPPGVMIPQPPEPTRNASLRFFYTLADDYGVTKAEAQLRLVPATPQEALALADAAAMEELTGKKPEDDGSPWPSPQDPVTLSLPVSGGANTISQETAIKSLADHPWAGRDVLVQIMAEDGAGQQAFSDSVRVTLPRRVFLQPLARALIELRDVLVYADDGVDRTAAGLDALAVRGDRFIDDSVVYLGLRSAFWRLQKGPQPTEQREVYDLMWDLALRIEDGDLSETLQRLRQLQAALADALQRGAPDAEIRQLMAELREALDRYLSELAQATDREAADPDAAALSTGDLDRLLQAIEQMARMGARGQAEQMLAELQQLLEGLRPGGAGQGQGPGGEPSPQEKALGDALGELSDIIGDQRALLDETYRNTGPGRDPLRESLQQNSGPNPLKRQRPWEDDFVNGPPGSAPSPFPLPPQGQDSDGQPQAGSEGSGEGTSLAERQDALRKRLQEVLKGLAQSGLEQPGSLDEAGREMGNAGSSLRGRQFDDAFSDQRSALEALRSGAEALAAEALRRQGPGRAGRSNEPFGPNGQQGLTGQGVDLPTKSDLQRAREIIEELRKRSSERDRPQLELDYFNRLLRQF